MSTADYNESDTRAKLIDPALYAAQWVEQVAEAERDTHGEIHREQSAVRIDILDGKPLKRGGAGWTTCCARTFRALGLAISLVIHSP